MKFTRRNFGLLSFAGPAVAAAKPVSKSQNERRIVPLREYGQRVGVIQDFLRDHCPRSFSIVQIAGAARVTVGYALSALLMMVEDGCVIRTFDGGLPRYAAKTGHFRR